MSMPPLPPHMAAHVARTEAAEAAAAELAAAEAADDRALRRRIAEVAEHHWEATTGHTSAEWEQARQAAVDARDAAGFDASAPYGWAAHPEPLVDGQSLRPDSARAPVRLGRSVGPAGPRRCRGCRLGSGPGHAPSACRLAGRRPVRCAAA